MPDMTTITISVPDEVASDLRDAGLLAPEAAADLATILRDSLRRFMVRDVVRTADRVLIPKGSPPSLEEIQEEVKSLRASWS